MFAWRGESSSMPKNNYFLNANYVILFFCCLSISSFTWQQQIFMKHFVSMMVNFPTYNGGSTLLPPIFAHIFSGINVYLRLKIINVVGSSCMWYKFYEYKKKISAYDFLHFFFGMQTHYRYHHTTWYAVL